MYISKNRSGFSVGSYVVLQQLEQKKIVQRPYFYNIDYLEPIKIEMIEKIFSLVDSMVESYENCIVVGSCLERGFHFNDVDIIIISQQIKNKKEIEQKMAQVIGIKAQIISIDQKALIKWMATDPLYHLMLSKCVAQKRFIMKAEQEINYKLLDLYLLKSKTLIDNTDMFDGNEKYYSVRNMIAIRLFLLQKKITKESVDREIEKIFRVKDVKEIQQNRVNKNAFVNAYRRVYNETFHKIMEGIRRGAEQK